MYLLSFEAIGACIVKYFPGATSTCVSRILTR
jgi:hypothetical protein